MTIKNYSHTRLVLSQPVMSAAPALLLFEHHCRWAGVLWCCGGPAPVPVSRNPMLTARNAKKEKQNSKVPTRFQTDPSTPDGQVMQEHSIEWCMHMNSHRQLQSLHCVVLPAQLVLWRNLHAQAARVLADGQQGKEAAHRLHETSPLSGCSPVQRQLCLL